MSMPQVAPTRMNIDALVPHESNPRKITPAKLARLRDKMTRWGDLGVVVYNKRTQRVLSGHQRLKNLRSLGEEQADVKVVDVDESEELAIMQALNEHDGTWDHDMRALGLQAINAAKPELLPLTGLHPDKVKTILEGLGVKVNLPKPEDFKEVPYGEKPKNPVTKPGDVWILGDHRLACGDSLDPGIVDAVMAGDKAHCVHTDPPYGVAYKDNAIANDDLVGDGLYQFILKALTNAARVTHDDAGWYIWHADSNADEFRDAVKAAGLRRLQTCNWFKPTPAPTRSDYQYTHEPCYYAVKDGHAPKFHGDRTNMTTWILEARTKDGTPVTQVAKGLEVTDGDGRRLWLQADPPTGKKVRRVRILSGRTMQIVTGEGGTGWLLNRDQGTVHPTQKPVALCAKPISNSSQPGEIVFDGFGGSGSTLIACEQLGRKARLVELDAGWCDVIVSRWESLTGKKATLEAKA